MLRGIRCLRWGIYSLILVLFAAAADADEGRVLRHAVFFKFTAETDEAQVAEVVEAFAGLPGEIDAIRGFEWGEKTSEVGLEGYTHAFLLTFADEAGRAEYLPHPAHEAFGKSLKGKIGQPFVIDYWGEAKGPAEDALRHAVFLKFKPGTSEEDIRGIDAMIRALPGEIEEVLSFEGGENVSVEPFDDGFTHAYLMSFKDTAALEAYVVHPTHQVVAQRLREVVEAIRVFDYVAE